MFLNGNQKNVSVINYTIVNREINLLKVFSSQLLKCFMLHVVAWDYVVSPLQAMIFELPRNKSPADMFF